MPDYFTVMFTLLAVAVAALLFWGQHDYDRTTFVCEGRCYPMTSRVEGRSCECATTDGWAHLYDVSGTK